MTTRRTRKALWLAAPLLLANCSTSPAQTTADSPGPRVLMVGNSLTYFNDLPGMLDELLSVVGAPGRIASITGPNMGLEDHWLRGEVFDSLRSSGWDVVIMQQGPSATEGRPSLLQFSEMFADSIRRYGAEPGLYMVWPAETRSFDFPGVIDSYRMAADLVGGILFPVGEAWTALSRADPEIGLYGPDRFHPSPTASYLAAVIMMQQLTGRDPLTIDPSTGPGARLIRFSQLSSSQLATLHSVASQFGAQQRSGG